MCVALALDTSGAAPRLTPTVTVRASQAVGGTPVVAEVDAVPFHLVLGASPELVLTPAVTATAVVGELTGVSLLVDTTLTGSIDVKIGAARLGITVDTTQGPRPVVEAHRIDFGPAGTHLVLDLTNADAVLAAAEAALSTAIDGVLNALGDTAPARALLTLAGIAVPNGRTAATWPHTITNPLGVLADPVGAIRGYFLAVLAAGDGDVLVGEIVRLLGVAAPTLDGTGTAVDPWRAELAGQDLLPGLRLSVGVLLWTTTDGPRRLHLGLDLHAALPRLGDVGPSPVFDVRAELVRLTVDGSPGAVAIPAFHFLVRTGALQLEVGDVVVAADDLRGGADWTAGTGLAPVVEVTNPRLVRFDNSTIPLPVPAWDAAATRLVWPGASPWDALEPVLAALLSSLGSAALADLPVLLGWARVDGGGAVVPTTGAPRAPGAWRSPTSSRTRSRRWPTGSSACSPLPRRRHGARRSRPGSTGPSPALVSRERATPPIPSGRPDHRRRRGGRHRPGRRRPRPRPARLRAGPGAHRRPRQRRPHRRRSRPTERRRAHGRAPPGGPRPARARRPHRRPRARRRALGTAHRGRWHRRLRTRRRAAPGRSHRPHHRRRHLPHRTGRGSTPRSTAPRTFPRPPASCSWFAAPRGWPTGPTRPPSGPSI